MEDDSLVKKTKLSHFNPQVSYFIAGGVAGATSRTVVSPLERLKIIQSVLRQWAVMASLSLNMHVEKTDRYSHEHQIHNIKAYGEALSEFGGKKVLRVT
jgi:hypothetical protein